MYVNNYPLSRQLGLALKEKHLKLAIAESCTGGHLAKTITRVIGASAWFDRGFITYTNQSKIDLLSVDSMVIDQHGAVSQEVVQLMAEGVVRHSQASIGLAITGVAGPGGGSVQKPVGTVWFGLATLQDCWTRQRFFLGGRKHVQLSAVNFALQWLLVEVTRMQTLSKDLA